MSKKNPQNPLPWMAIAFGAFFAFFMNGGSGWLGSAIMLIAIVIASRMWAEDKAWEEFHKEQAWEYEEMTRNWNAPEAVEERALAAETRALMDLYRDQDQEKYQNDARTTVSCEPLEAQVLEGSETKKEFWDEIARKMSEHEVRPSRD
jgi:hypothetical protein